MNIYDTKIKINQIKQTTNDYQDSIRNVQTNFLEFIDELSSVGNSINNELHEDTIAAYSSKAITEIISEIENAINNANNALSTLSVDATKEIKRLVDAYNSSLEPDSKEERLYYDEIHLSGIGGGSPFSGGTGGKRDTYIYPGGTGGKDGKQVTVDYYFDMLKSKKVYSSKIKNWDSYVNNFLEKNSLTKVIDTIIVNGKVIKVKLKNGKEYKFKNITNSLDLLKALSKKIEKDQNNK